MALQEILADFAGALAVASTDAPDDYPEWGYTTFESNKADLRSLWSEIRGKLKHDQDQIIFIDSKLKEAILALDAGEKEIGRSAILAIYNLDVKKLR